MAQANLVLHRGAREVSRDALAAVSCPAPSGRWRPVPHGQVLDYAEKALTDAGYGVEKQTLALSRDDARFFAVLTLNHRLVSGVHLAVGIRSSTDKSISLQYFAGHRVFVCDNLAFSSTTVIARKHTTRGIDRYQEAIAKAVTGLGDYSRIESARITTMQRTEIDDQRAESLLLRAFEQRLIGPHALPTAIDEWRKPSWAEFEGDKTLWRLFNAVTFALGARARSNPQAHATATIRLSGLLLPQDAGPADPSPN